MSKDGVTGSFSKGNLSSFETEENEEIKRRLSKKKLPPNPELDNFLSKVDEVTQIIQGLASDNPTLQEKALRKADILIGKDSGENNNEFNNINEEKEAGAGTAYKVTSNRSVINKVAPDDVGQGDMSQAAFMRCVEKDAAERARDRKERKEHSDEFRKYGNIAFRKQNWAEALDNFNKAIELIKDSPCLYNNRALTYLRIGIYSKAIEDCDKAIHLAEGSIKAHLLKAKAYFLKEEPEKCKDWLKETREIFPNNIEMINAYEKELFEMRFLEVESLKSKKKKNETDNKQAVYDPDAVWKKAARHELPLIKTEEFVPTSVNHDEDDENENHDEDSK